MLTGKEITMMKTVGINEIFVLIKNYDFINNCVFVTIRVVWKRGYQLLQITKFNTLEFNTECVPIIVL